MVALSIWPRVLALNLTACPQPVVAFTFHTCVSQSFPVVAIVMSPMKRILAQKIIIADSARSAR
jgi:hypothetical protein